MKIQPLNALALAAISISCSCSTRIAYADTVAFSQPPDYSSANASQNDTSSGGLGNFATTYDDFTLANMNTITGVQWYGGYFNPSSRGSITGFTLTFYSGNGSSPGSVLSTLHIGGDANETLVQNDAAGDPTYRYSAPVDLVVSGRTQEWLSIVPDLAFPPQWGWETSSAGNRLAYQCFFSSCNTNAAAQAFSLTTSTTQVTPEPSSLLLLGTGALGFCASARRRLRRRAV